MASRDLQRLKSENSQELEATIRSWLELKSQLEDLQKDPNNIQRRKLISNEIESLELSLNQLIRANQEQQWKDYQRQLKEQSNSLNQLTILLGFCFAFATLFCLYTLRFIETRQQLLEEMRQESTTDELTQIANRRYFNRVLKQEWNRTLREGNTIVLILCDIDFFKQYNDYYGHQVGDRCLHQVAQALSAGLRRSGEFVARYGGEEFVVVSSRLTPVQAEELSAHLHDKVRQLALEHGRSVVERFVTISMGIAIGVPTLGLNPENALTYADQALYEAKARGRNQSCLHVFGDAAPCDATRLPS